MSVSLYMDENISRDICIALRRRGVDVLTAQEDGMRSRDDAVILDRASSLNRVLFSQDKHLLIEASRRQQNGESFSGVIYVHQMHISLGQCVRDLELIAIAGDTADYLNRVQYLPLR